MSIFEKMKRPPLTLECASRYIRYDEAADQLYWTCLGRRPFERVTTKGVTLEGFTYSRQLIVAALTGVSLIDGRKRVVPERRIAPRQLGPVLPLPPLTQEQINAGRVRKPTVLSERYVRRKHPTPKVPKNLTAKEREAVAHLKKLGLPEANIAKHIEGLRQAAQKPWERSADQEEEATAKLDLRGTRGNTNGATEERRSRFMRSGANRSMTGCALADI